MLHDQRILVTGAAGRVGFPIARELAAQGNAVFGLARYRDPAHLDKVRAVGIEPVATDIHDATYDELPDGINYSFSKIAGEAIVAHTAVEHDVPATIIRICSTYGPEGGAPWDRIARMIAGEEIRLHPDAPNNYNPIHEDDQVQLGIRALEVASVPAITVNWGGSETVSAEGYLAFAGSLLGVTPNITYGDGAYHPLWPDVTRMHEVLGHCEVPWQDGFR